MAGYPNYILTVFLAFCPMQAKNNRKIISISKLFTTMKNNLKIWWGTNVSMPIKCICRLERYFYRNVGTRN
jgi:hypothetical protein